MSLSLTDVLKTACTAKLQANVDDEIYITGYKRSKWRTFLCYVAIALTAGILRLVMHWWTHWYLIATHKKYPLDRAEMILVAEHYQGKHTIYHVKKVFDLNADTMLQMETNGDKNFVGMEPLDNDEKNFQVAIHQHRGVFKCKYAVTHHEWSG